MQNAQQNRKPNPTTHEMNSMPQPSGGHARSARLAQCLEVKQCEPAHRQYKRTTQAGYDAESAFYKYLVMIKTQLTRSGREPAQSGKGP